MWTCSLLKSNAWQALRGRYWRSFWVCLVLMVLSGALLPHWEIRYSGEDLLDTVNYFSAVLNSLSASTLLAIYFGLLLGMVLYILWSTFVVTPLSVGQCRYFMESRQSRSPFRTIFTIFRTPYLNVVKVTFLTSLKIFVGLLLFLIPGIYWAYCYALVPYLMAENPYLTTSRAMALSRRIMYGEKFHRFLLKLSFLGWALLCLFTFGIGFFFLAPYQEATYAEFYAAMRAKAFAQGLTSPQELGGFVRHAPD